MEKKKMNDKGFSLVELIIVIAIMAILIGVLAPQYLKFVERSRKSTDRQNVDEIIRAIEIYVADPEATEALGNASGTATVTLTTTPTAVSSSNASDNTDVALEAAGIKTIGLKSKKWASTTITLTFTFDSNGNVSVTSSDPDILSSTSGTT